jgi:simple sugar transport system permease protein
MTWETLSALTIAVLGGAIRVGTPFIFVSLGECLTEKSGRINLGLEGVLVFSAMAGFGLAYLSGLWWVGVLAAGLAGALMALLHGMMASLPRVNDIAAGIAIMLFGAGLAFYLGKPLIQPSAPDLQAIELGEWSALPAVQQALGINPLFVLGVALAFAVYWAFGHTRVGLRLRVLRLERLVLRRGAHAGGGG